VYFLVDPCFACHVSSLQMSVGALPCCVSNLSTIMHEQLARHGQRERVILYFGSSPSLFAACTLTFISRCLSRLVQPNTFRRLIACRITFTLRSASSLHIINIPRPLTASTHDDQSKDSDRDIVASSVSWRARRVSVDGRT
jgi:hypothetical protein